jgi:hypothetical protein
VLKVRRECLIEDSLKGVSEVVGTGQEEIKKGLTMKRVKDLSDKHKEPFLPQAAGVNAFFARKFDSFMVSIFRC